MAHHCDICGVLCHCGGDIGDLCFDDSPEAIACTHCAPDEDAPEGYDDEDEEYF